MFGRSIAGLAAIVLAALAATQAPAQDFGARPLRYGNTSGWFFDGRDDDRDFPTNGFFPGNSTADPPSAWLGAAGLFGGNSYRSRFAYPSQVVIGAPPAHVTCRHLRSSDPSAGTFVGRDGARHRC
ncbi:MAG: BA14K family protein [Bradyrhizobium sp.]|uniref:BA14K family protein n=1 Tax=Bradyrhizobium sp. TaxID=376 RepID=UPI001D9F6CC4|nr:BA14K family protein [Bradyrhizobium sp.]MBV9560285.1 BA14K family protein [Bradyrhizobium sp.]